MEGRAPIHAMLFFVITFWGLAFAGIKVVTNEGVSWVALTVWRFAIGCGILAAFLALRPGARAAVDRRDIPALFAFGFLGYTGYHFFLNYGEATGAPSGSAALIIAVAPAFMAVLAVVHLRERLTPQRVAGLAVAFLGLAVMILLQSSAGSLQVGLSPALAAVAPAAVFAAFFSVYGKPYLKKYPPLTFVAYTMFAGTALMLPVAAWYGPATATDLAKLSSTGWAALLFLGTCPTVIAYGLWFKSLERIEASAAAAYIYLSTVLAVVSGLLLLGEPITATLVLGGAMVIGGVYLAQRNSKH